MNLLLLARALVLKVKEKNQLSHHDFKRSLELMAQLKLETGLNSIANI